MGTSSLQQRAGLPLRSSCLALLVMACGGTSYQHLVERELAADAQLLCPGFLVWNNEPVRDVFLIINGSGTLSNAFVHPTFQGLLSTEQVAYATYDKPGVWAPFDDPAAVRRDDALLQRYTLGHGIACATQALRWSREQLGPSVRLHIRGHSEGTLVGLYTYAALLDDDPETASALATLVLSGIALEPFADILERQLATLAGGERLRQALAACDWGVLRNSLGISCAYVADATQRPSGQAMFERLAARGLRSRFYIFHGTEDTNTPVEPVRALEAWNASNGQLQMQFHYYQGGHSGSAAARSEVARVLAAIVSE